MSDHPQKRVLFTTQRAFASRLILATLTGRPIRITRIRPSSPTNLGVAPHEISLLRLLEAVTNGSMIEVSMTGTTVDYRPGLITGSTQGLGANRGVIRHEVPAACTRGVSYFLIPLCLLAPFSKSPINVLFSGPGVITSATPAGDLSVDSVRTAILPMFANFGILKDIELRILRRSNPGPRGKGGAGEVQLVFGHQVRLPKTLHLLNPGRIKRIRGVAYCTGVPASNNARMIEAARGILNHIGVDIYVYSDVSSAPHIPSNGKANPTGKTKTGIGFGLSLVAESSTGCLYSADVASPPSGGAPPEDIGQQCAHQLLEFVAAGGAVSIAAVPTILTLMSMSSEDVGRVQLGKGVLSADHIIDLARDMKALGLSPWGFRETSTGQENDIVVSVVGKGVGNVGRKIA